MQVKKDKITGDALGTGRRKTSVARVRLKAGTGKITINDRPIEEYFPSIKDRNDLFETLEAVSMKDSVDISITASGGGMSGQAGACKMGIARALISYNSETFPPLRDKGFLTRDSRMKERKHYGLRGARRGVQFSKR